MPARIVLRASDLPLPVVPPISRWGELEEVKLISTTFPNRSSPMGTLNPDSGRDQRAHKSDAETKYLSSSSLGTSIVTYPLSISNRMSWEDRKSTRLNSSHV